MPLWNSRSSRKRRPNINDLTYERDLQETIREAASLFKWPCYYHTHDSRRSPEGFPDVIIAGYGELLMWELKGEGGHLTGAQETWIGTLGEVTRPPKVGVYRPSDLDECLEILKRKGS